MQVKKFEAPTMEEAINVIKRELGPEAIILSTRENGKAFGLLKRPSVEVTAAISEQALLKKKIAESKMKDETKSKVQKQKTTEMAATYDRFARKARQAGATENTASEALRPANGSRPASNQSAKAILTRPKAQKRYVDIQDHDDELAIFQPRTESKVSPVTPALMTSKTPVLPNKLQAPTTGSTVANQAVSAPRAQPADMGLLKEHLIYVGVNAEIANQIVNVVQGDNEIWKSIRRESIAIQMKSLIPIVLNMIRMGRPLWDEAASGRKLMSFFGPTGGGKTTTIAKIAARLKLQRAHSVGLLSVDVFRVGGFYHLQNYADLLGLPLAMASSAEEIPRIVQTQLKDCRIILVDTPGISELDVEKLSFVTRTLDSLGEAPRFLVTPVNQQVPLRRLIENGARYGGIRFDGHVFTKLDETDTRGEIINRAYCSKRPVYYLSTGQRVPEDLEIASREVIGQMIFHQYSWEN